MPLVIDCSGKLSRPIIVCDHCRAPIESASDGNMMWNMKGDAAFKEPRAVAFTHKACCHPFEQDNPGSWGSNDLDTALVYLANNLKMNEAAWKTAKWKAEQLATL